MYGTPALVMEKIRNKGKIPVFDLDMSCLEMMKRANVEMKYLFVSPTSIEELEKRIRASGQYTEEQIQAKIAQAVSDVGHGANPALFNAVLTNDELEFTLGELVYHLQNWYPNHDFDAIYLAHQTPK